MTNKEIYQKLLDTKLLPLYTVTNLAYLDKVEELLIRHDVRFIEVTFRSDLACAAIKQLAKSGQLIVGAGTVRTVEEAKQAVESGAQFIVSPAISPTVIDYCLTNELLIFPGTATPGDIQKAFEYGIKTVKFFPANIYGGLNAIKALSGPFSDIKFLPTGGIDEANFMEYLEYDNIVAVGGSFILSESDVMDDGGEKADKKLERLMKKLNQ
ncbi:2-dehydro-3-deoxyphosphogluconate aldolase/(4S)-4-hydroxy-2-oxoglutarate aldolase [Enterococcus sp. AZ194]|uniref:bifunctional 4-hydroxy-2-oxoglutarate aldolase/2-dehydro-3-deoxy-phosphogluconate aldolase n=1 Tax=Enterococcus sp. AZ194 TaxID=2774629 RepID=UPI003F20A14C